MLPFGFPRKLSVLRETVRAEAVYEYRIMRAKFHNSFPDLSAFLWSWLAFWLTICVEHCYLSILSVTCNNRPNLRTCETGCIKLTRPAKHSSGSRSESVRSSLRIREVCNQVNFHPRRPEPTRGAGRTILSRFLDESFARNSGQCRWSKADRSWRKLVSYLREPASPHHHRAGVPHLAAPGLLYKQRGGLGDAGPHWSPVIAALGWTSPPPNTTHKLHVQKIMTEIFFGGSGSRGRWISETDNISLET